MQLSIELGLAPRHIKFWFQNQRTPEKTHTRGVTGSSESQHRLVQPKEDLRKANELIVSIEKDKAKALDELKQVRKEEVYMKFSRGFQALQLNSWKLFFNGCLEITVFSKRVTLVEMLMDSVKAAEPFPLVAAASNTLAVVYLDCMEYMEMP
ncbi:hypothetical protein Bca101_058021 [Brassica carinata]